MEYLQHLLMRSLWVVLVVMLAVENGCNGCLEKERIALLELKDSINFPDRIDQLPSWEQDNSTDCCQWERVECNSTTRRVIKLELYHAREYRRDDYWHLNASILLPFESLRSLNLSWNYLSSFVGNEGIGTLSNLHYLEELDLSYNDLGNSILPSLNKLSNLKILNLAGITLDGSISAKGIGTLSNLHYLEELDLSDNYLGNSILPSLNKLSNLKILNLAGNGLDGSISAKGIGTLSNLHYLEELDLSYNSLNNSILPSLNKLSNLKILNLAGINLDGSISAKGIGVFPSFSNLEELDLSSNYLGNSILPSLNKLSNLKSLRLVETRLNDSICVKGTGILSNLTNLEELDLRYNRLGNGILPSLNKLSNLKVLRLASNNLNGSIYVKARLKELDLSSNKVVSIITVNGPQEESGILNKLEALYLSSNNLSNTSIWSFLGELSSIKALDLSDNYGLHGDVHRLCELKTLRELDIAGTGFGGTLPWCMMNLTFLRLLDISSNRFTGNIARSPLINMTSLEYLAISDNDFEIPISFKSFFNHSKLKFIESLNNKLLAEENFLTTSPAFQLIVLRLSNSEHGTLIKSFPHFLYHQHDLRMVKLSQIGVGENFPNWLVDNNARMGTLILSHNSLGGPLLLPSHPMRNLLVLDISNNHLEGLIPYKIAISFPSLVLLNMSTNLFKGNIPSSFGDMTALDMLDLSNNILSGEIPVHLAIGCRNLYFLKLSNNSLKGPILPRQNNLTQLEVLISDNNGFTEIPPNLSKSPLTMLNVSANQLAGKIPGFIGNISLWFLSMAGNHLEGPIPVEFCQLRYLRWLDLSENNITGAIPSCFNSSYIYSIRLSKNRLDGPFPMAFKNYSTNLMELDLSYNQFSGNIPTWIGSLSWLTVLLLQHNYFQGNIPKELCHLSRLNLIDLSFNNLSGNIPACVSKITFDGMGPDINFDEKVVYMPFRDQSWLPDLRMVLPKRIESRDRSGVELSNLETVDFATKGMSLSYKGIVLYLFSGINLSWNRLTGPIPPEIGNLSHIKVLNLSHNNFTGTIPVTFSNLKNIESLDLSYNHLHGKIPSQLTELTFLVVFYLSYNNLSGRTPQRIFQFANFESSSYVGNPLLCGEPLPRKCSATDSPPSTPRAAVNDTKEDSRFMDTDVFYMSFAGSYVTVILAIVAILLINPHWRRAWFHLVEVSITSCYYFAVDNIVGRRSCFHWK